MFEHEVYVCKVEKCDEKRSFMLKFPKNKLAKRGVIGFLVVSAKRVMVDLARVSALLE